MAVPQEIRKLLTAEPQSHAALSCSLHGPIGETHMVVADGRLSFFIRETLVGNFTCVALDPVRLPVLEAGDFADTLHVQLADGTSFELNVSSFEREAVARTLAAAAAEPTPESAPIEPTPDAPASPPEQQVEAPAGFGPAEAPALPLAAPAPEPDPEDEQAEKEPATYEASTLRLMPCLGMVLFFVGPIVGMWVAHSEAMLAMALLAPGEYLEVGFIFVITKILALVAGIYAGVKLLTLFNRFGTSRNWDGKVIFDRHGVKLIGPSNKWEITIDESRPFELSCDCHAEKPTSSSESAKRQHIYYLRIQQQGDAATLRTSVYATSPEPVIAGAHVVPIEREQETPNTLAMDEKVFRRVAARLRKLGESFARSGLAGDNERA
jgi:hypothetical protein